MEGMVSCGKPGDETIGPNAIGMFILRQQVERKTGSLDRSSEPLQQSERCIIL